mgnify:CR=1 FL=1
MGLVKEFEGRGLAAVAISSNSVLTHPQDGPDEMALDAKRYGGNLGPRICHQTVGLN